MKGSGCSDTDNQLHCSPRLTDQTPDHKRRKDKNEQKKKKKKKRKEKEKKEI